MKKWYNSPKYKAEDKCRFCIHTALWHMIVKDFGMDNQMARWDKCDRPKGVNHCDCPGFAPVDNLEYLEMVNDESSSL